MTQFLELDDGLVALDDLGTDARLAERGRALRQAQEAVKLRHDAHDGHPRRVVLVELAVELRAANGKGRISEDQKEEGTRQRTGERTLNWKSLTTICLRSRASLRSEMRRVVSGV